MDFQELTENKPGLIGLIVAVVGLLLVFVTPYLGVVALVGLVIAARGMKEEPKTLALGGMGAGGLGILLMLVFNFSGPSNSKGSSSGSNSPKFTDEERTRTKLVDLTDTVSNVAAQQGKIPTDFTALGGPPQRYNDPWGNPIVIKQTAERAYQISSYGPDGEEGTSDDIVVEGDY